MSRDEPSGDYDNESLEAYVEEDGTEICNSERPISIEARVIETKADYKTTRQIVTISPDIGFICKNSHNDRRCENYEIRLCCPGEYKNKFETFLNLNF